MRNSFVLFLAMAVAGCSGGHVSAPPDLGSIDGLNDPDAGLPPAVSGELAIRALEPDHGPFTGGSQVIVRGVSFPEDSIVFFDGSMVQPAYQEWLDPTRILVITPAGEPGPADVTVEVGMPGVDDGAVTLAGGFVYDAFYVDPTTGPELGGTGVTLHGQGTAFSASTVVTFGEAELEDVVIVSVNEITGTTPPGPEGPVDVTVTTAEGSLQVRDGFTYYPGVSLGEGGVGGGEIEEALSVTVVDYVSGAPITDAYVIVGVDPATPHQGMTDGSGKIVFTGAFTPPVTLSAGSTGASVGAVYCESTTIVSFNAREAVIRLICIPPVTPGGGGGPGIYGAYVEGVIQFGDPSGIGGTNVWYGVPDPATPTQTLCAKVGATIPNLYSPNPDTEANCPVRNSPSDPIPATCNLAAHVPYDPEKFAWPYNIFVRPGVMAIYALAGICDTATGKEVFTAYAMGIARGVVAGPGDGQVPGQPAVEADIVMDIPLDRSLDVRLDGVSPLGTAAFGGPTRHFLALGIDLGGDGILLRWDSNVVFDSGGGLQTIVPGQAALAGPALWDASYVFVGGADNSPGGPLTWPEAADVGRDGLSFYLPYTAAIERGVTNISSPIAVDGFVGMPEFVSPTPYSYIVNRRLEWTHEGAPAPGLSHLTLSNLFDDSPVWRMFVEGTTTAVDIPDLAAVAGLPDIPGNLYWELWNIAPVGDAYNFDSFAYRDALAFVYYEAFAWVKFPVYYTP